MGEKQAVEMALTVLVSFQTSLPYNSFMISSDNLTAVALLSLSMEYMKFCSCVFTELFFLFAFMLLMSLMM